MVPRCIDAALARVQPPALLQAQLRGAIGEKQIGVARDQAQGRGHGLHRGDTNSAIRVVGRDREHSLADLDSVRCPSDLQCVQLAVRRRPAPDPATF